MPLVMRVIRRSRWYKTDQSTWLTSRGFQADAFNDITTTSNELSLWVIEDDRSNLDRVATACAANRDNFAVLDYGLVEMNILENLNIKIENVPGNTPDEEVNTRYHRNIVEVSGWKLYNLAKAISKGTTSRYTEGQIKRMIRAGVQERHIEISKLKEGIRNKVTITR